MGERSQRSDVALLKRGINKVSESVVNPTFVVLSGLPGSGKSHLCRQLAGRVPLLILEADKLRRVLFSHPTYTSGESTRLFQACHLLIEELLRDGVGVVFDATTLSERHREPLYRIAEKANAKLVLVRVICPPEVIRQRLERRSAGYDSEDNSEADWGIYTRMLSAVEAIRRDHYVVDTSKDTRVVLGRIARETSNGY